MRRGYNSKLLFSSSGNLVAFGTGSDACAEHEGGSDSLLKSLTRLHEDEAATLKALREDNNPFFNLRRTIFGKKPVNYPDLLESRRVSKFPKELQFVLKPGKVPEATLGVSTRSLSEEGSRELQFHDHSSYQDHDVAGAWDDKSFAIRVRGDRYVKALTAFHEALRAGNVAFGGKFMKRGELGGVIMVNTKFLSDEEKTSIRTAQVEANSKLRLKAREDSGVVSREMQQLAGTWPGFLWAVWADEAESDIVYRLNPGHGVNAEYSGPYTREELLKWARARYSYPLKRQEKAAG